MRNDRLIQQEVVRKLSEYHVPDGEIGVEVHHGVVKLSGGARDFAAKRNAELAARSVGDVLNVILDIDIAVANARAAPRLVCVAPA